MSDKILVVGSGSIGERHIRNLRKLGEANIIAFDPAAERLAKVVRDYQINKCSSIEAGLAENPKAVLICTPPHLHAPLMAQAVNAGVHVFVEKPIASSLDGIEDSLAEAERQALVVYVGYNLRFHSGILKLKEMLDNGAIGRALMIRAEIGQYLPDWRPAQEYRAGYNVSSKMGGGIILDASHELDYVRWLGGEVEAVYCVAGHLSRLEMDTEDAAAIILQMASGLIAEVHLDCIQRAYARNCKVIGEEGTLTWDFNEGVHLFTGDKKDWQSFPMTFDSNQMYVEEMRHFLRSVAGEEEPLVDGRTGLQVLRIALAARRSAELRQVVQL